MNQTGHGRTGPVQQADTVLLEADPLVQTTLGNAMVSFLNGGCT